jgi:hypothetical protein
VNVTFSSSSETVKLPGFGPTPEHDRVVVAAPAAAHALRPCLRDALVAEPLLDERHEIEHARGHQVVQHLPLVLHLAAQPPRLIDVARVERLDRAVHRRTRELGELLVGEPAVCHRCPPRMVDGVQL